MSQLTYKSRSAPPARMNIPRRGPTAADGKKQQHKSARIEQGEATNVGFSIRRPPKALLQRKAHFGKHSGGKCETGLNGFCRKLIWGFEMRW